MVLHSLYTLAGIIYITLGVFIFSKKWFFVELDDQVAYGLGGLMIAYGIFRIVRAVLRIRTRKDEI